MSLENALKKIKSLVPKVDEEINDFIKEAPKEENEIERTLDYLMYPELEKQFKKLLNYYEKINPEAAKDYQKYYNDLYN